MQVLQKTIKDKAHIEGVGIHTGKPVRVEFHTAPPNSGIKFVRTDLPGKPVIDADISNIVDGVKRPRRTSIGKDGIEVQTIEHVMATLFCLGIDNITIFIDAPELPGLDGSASGFLNILKQAGIQEQNSPKRTYQLKEPIWLEEQGATISALPSSEFRISYTLSYQHPFLRAQYWTSNINPEVFETELAPSRTFCLKEEVEELKLQGLGMGANYENTLVLSDKGVINNKLRFEDEFVRHKVVDLIGDLNLLGFNLCAHIIALKSGHPLNIKLLQRIKNQYQRAASGGIKAGSIVNEAGEYKLPFDINMIQKILPHRPPFLLIDKIIELEQPNRAVGIKDVSIDEYYFQGHFPARPIMPGVLILEALAQVAGVLMLSKKENFGKVAYFMSMDNVKFRRPVLPGDQLRLEVNLTRLRSKVGSVHAAAYVDNKIVAEADLMFSLVE